jgi:hypothetical protein
MGLMDNPVDAMMILDMASMSKDPYKWVLYSFSWGTGDLLNHTGPDTWQEEILKAIRDGVLDYQDAIRIAVASGHGIGKSALVSWLILWALSTHEDTLGVVTANTETQLRTKTWANLAKWHRLFIAKHWFKLAATAIYSVDPAHEKTWRIDAVPWSEHNTESFAGLHNEGKRILILFDEASTIPDTIWEVAMGALTDTNTEIIWAVFGNPTRNSGMFREVVAGRFRHRWKHWQIDSRDCRIANKALAEELIADYGLDSDIVKVRVRGMFPSMSARQFFSVEDVDGAFGRELRKDQYDFAPIVLTIDPAFEGDDALEIGRRQGLSFKIIRTIPKNDNDIQIAQIIAQIEDEEKADAVFIDGGFGTGIVSAGRTWGRHWQIVWFSGAAGKPGFLNKRAEMAQDAKQWLKDGGCLPDDHELREDILCPEVVSRTDGKVQLESKKEIKKRLGRSPGKLDAWILSFAFPVYKQAPGAGPLGRAKEQVSSDYDPYTIAY